MKRSFLLLSFLIATPCLAQWRNIGFGNPNGGDLQGGPVLAMCAHDSFFFLSRVPDDNTAPLIYRYSISVNNWVPVDSGIATSQGDVTTFASLGTYIFAGSGPPNVGNGYISTNNGSTWTDPIGGPIGTNGKYIFAQYATRIARSRDSGKTWEHQSVDAGNSYDGAGACVFANTGSGIWHSIDSGGSWIKDTLPSGLSLSGFTSLNSQLFAGGSGLFRSTDSGQTWKLLSLQNRTVNALVSYKTYLFAGTDSGVFISFDSGVTWKNEIDNMGSPWPGYYPNVKLLEVLDTFLFASVDAGMNQTNHQEYGFVTDRPISEMTDTTNSIKGGVREIALADSIEIYPNPSTGTFTISASVPILSVQVTSIIGTNTLTLPRINQQNVSLDLSDRPSGTYFIQIQTPDRTILRKIVVSH